MSKQIIACVPRDRSRLPQDSTLDNIQITDLYSLRQCEACGQDIWIGPRQSAFYAQDPASFFVLCFECAVPVVAAINGGRFNPDSDVRHLGGGSQVEGRPRIT